jgi:2'-5' RNA ligase
VRCFIAAGGTGDLVGALGPWLARTREAFPEVSVTPEDNLHLTLAFLGELDESQVEAAQSATVAAAGQVPEGWSLGWGAPGAFPNLRRPRVLWLGVARGLEQLTTAHGGLVDELRRRQLPVEERAFRPHLTLARVRRPPLAGPRASDMASWLAGAPAVPDLTVDGLVLYQSKLGRPAAVHVPILAVSIG